MTTLIRTVDEAELEAILAINNAAIPDVNELSKVTLGQLVEQAAYFRIAERDGAIAGFLLALTPEADYASDNFRWFKDQYDAFVYIDRVVVAKGHRGHGIGNIIYADIHSFAEQVAPRLTCEVNLEPRNEVSLLFHAAHGFHEVGQQRTEGGQKKVSLLARELPDYNYVRRRYG